MEILSVHPQQVRLRFRVSAGLPQETVAKLFHLGDLKVGADWRGRSYFDLPVPFSDVRIFDGETFTTEKRALVLTALQYFDGLRSAVRNI